MAAKRDDLLTGIADEVSSAMDQALDRAPPELTVREVGRVLQVSRGFALISGLPGARADEVISFGGDRLGMVFNLDADRIGVVLMDSGEDIQTGDEVRRTGRVMDTPVGEALLGRVVDPMGQPLDGGAPPRTSQRRPIESDAPAILDRSPVNVPLQTGIKAVDALIPVGRGQRELIIGDRQTGKTAIALDAIVNQRDTNVLCVYCAIGQGGSAVAKIIADLRRLDALDYTIVMVSGDEDPAGLRFAAPYAATSMAEHFMEQGRNVLIVYDDLTRHARAYRELSLLLRRPPGREAFPGDIFYVHSRLLERSTHLIDELGGGSLTALPIIETQAQNMSAYIPTNLISITDGQIYVSPDLFQRGQLPAIDVGRSVSRVGGKAQLRAFREVAGDLRLAYSQFEELERFSRYGTRLEESQQRRLTHGRRVREVLKQPRYDPLSPGEQIAVLLAVSEGILDDVPIAKVQQVQESLRGRMPRSLSEVADRIETGQKPSDADRDAICRAARDAVAEVMESTDDANA